MRSVLRFILFWPCTKPTTLSINPPSRVISRSESVDYYRDISNSTNPQPSQTLTVVTYDEVVENDDAEAYNDDIS